MSSNALIVTVLIALVLVAAMARVVIGPGVDVKGGEALYSVAKVGPIPVPSADQVEMAAGGASAQR